MINLPTYVLVTPVKNEETHIGTTIGSVIAQTRKPLRWVIVSDGSTDNTNEIVRAAMAQHDWIHLIELPARKERSFAAVVRATEIGFAAIRDLKFGFVGLLDSDLRFQNDYFEQLLLEFGGSPKLGLAGGVCIDIGLNKNELPRNRRDVPGAVQFFRRECFEGLNGLIAIPEGGWDSLTCARARMIGYDTQLVVRLIVDHLKPRNIAEGNILRRTFQMGLRDYAVGTLFLFEIAKCLSRVAHRPAIIGSIAWMSGYFWALLSRRQRHIPSNLLCYLRFEQRQRLWALFPDRVRRIFASQSFSNTHQ